MIYHFPGSLPSSMAMGSTIRPQMMLKAFKKKGYEIEVIEGAFDERKRKIQDLKNKINNGNKYLYAYSESSWLPTLLSDGNKIPKFSPIDYYFFRLCKINRIKIGLFYRDIYWKFNHLRLDVELGLIKSLYVKLLYELDLTVYNNLIDILFLPSLEMKKYLPSVKVCSVALPPGLCADFKSNNRQLPNKRLNILYVGGLSRLSVIAKLCQVVSTHSYLTLTICTNKEHWEKERHRYLSFLNSSIQVVHKSGGELVDLYDSAHVAALVYELNVYKTFTVSTKLFQYMQHELPIVATEGTLDASFVSEHKIGWTIPYDSDRLSSLLFKIWKDPAQILDKRENMIRIMKNHTWGCRARQVERILSV